MKKFKTILIIPLFFLIASAFYLPIATLETRAESLWDMQANSGIDKVGQAYNVSNPESDDNKIQIIVAKVIKAALSFFGIIFVGLLVWAGYKYMTSQGSEDKISEAVGQIRTAIIGLIIVLVSWSITTYITDCVLDITQGGMLWMCQ